MTHDAPLNTDGEPVRVKRNGPPNCYSIACRSGKLLIEGSILRVENDIGPAALLRLAELIDREGPEALSRVEGDFIALLGMPRQVYAFKSFTSQYQVYYRRSDSLVANRLCAFFDERAVWNEDYFARHVLIVPGYQFLSSETPLGDVNRVLPGELVAVGRSIVRKQLISRRYTYLIDPAQCFEDVAPRILQTLRDSIKTRLAAHPDAKICIEISGGLDSSFVACLLGEQVVSGMRGVMFSQPNLPSHAISEQYAREVADRYGIDLRVIGPDELPDTIDPAPRYSDEPSDFFWFGDWFSKSVADVAEPGSMVFTGFGADQLFLRSPAFLPYLLKHGEYRRFVEALTPASDLLSRGRANIAWQSILSLAPAGLHHRLNMAFAKRSWNPFDVSDVNMQRMLTEPVPWVLCGRGLEAYSIERDEQEKVLVGSGIICDDWGYFSAPRTVTQSHFIAKGLVDASPFCDLSLQDLVYNEVSALLVHKFDGRYKELLRQSQQGIVPESLRNRQNDTFVFNSFQLNYVNQAREYFLSLLDSVPQSWIDREAANYALEQLSFGITTSSTRSLMALMGYLRWRQAFLRRCADGSKDISLLSARPAPNESGAL
jgi:asparagine synthase (glutamine-hydrolysing)